MTDIDHVLATIDGALAADGDAMRWAPPHTDVPVKVSVQAFLVAVKSAQNAAVKLSARINRRPARISAMHAAYAVNHRQNRRWKKIKH